MKEHSYCKIPLAMAPALQAFFTMKSSAAELASHASAWVVVKAVERGSR